MIETGVPFNMYHVVHLVKPAGASAHDLQQLADAISVVPDDALFYHAVQYQLRDPACAELPPDDFTAWVGGVVQDRETAERLSFAVQTRNSSARELREALLEVLSAVPERTRRLRDAPEGGDFVFLVTESVPVPTGTIVWSGEDLMAALAEADISAWFYHVMQQPWLLGNDAPLGGWLAQRGESRLAGWLQDSASRGEPLEQSRRSVLRRWRQSLLGRRVARASEAPAVERRELGRAAVADLVRRVTGSREPPDRPVS